MQAFPAPQQEIDLDQGKEKRAGRDWGKLQTGERGRTKLVHDWAGAVHPPNEMLFRAGVETCPRWCLIVVAMLM